MPNDSLSLALCLRFRPLLRQPGWSRGCLVCLNDWPKRSVNRLGHEPGSFRVGMYSISLIERWNAGNAFQEEGHERHPLFTSEGLKSVVNRFPIFAAGISGRLHTGQQHPNSSSLDSLNDPLQVLFHLLDTLAPKNVVCSEFEYHYSHVSLECPVDAPESPRGRVA